MKIDMMESLGYSSLRHVQRCWIVQTNWKWPNAAFEGVPEGFWDEFREEFEAMKTRFGTDVFKETKDVEQLLKQAELDALGVTRDRELHALEAAFHEQGLRYGSSPEDTRHTVQKKMLRTYLVLKGLRYSDADHHIWFVSPRVRGERAKVLESLFEKLEASYDDVHWHLCIGKSVNTEVLQPTLSATENMSDTSELLVRANTLLNVVRT